MRRVIVIIAALLCCSWLSRAQVNLDEEFFSLPDSVTHSYLDSVKVNIAAPNDYWMVGVFGGAAVQYGYWNPDRYVLWQPQYPVLGFSLVRHFTMFGIFPNMDNYTPTLFFDMMEGCYTYLPPTHAYAIRPPETEALPVLARLNYASMRVLKWNREQRGRCLKLLNDFYRLHIPSFPELQSLDVLTQVFD